MSGQEPEEHSNKGDIGQVEVFDEETVECVPGEQQSGSQSELLLLGLVEHPSSERAAEEQHAEGQHTDQQVGRVLAEVVA